MGVGLAALLMLLPLSFPTLLAIQQESSSTERLNLGFDQSVPGDVAFIAVMFSTSGEVEIGKIITEITFPREILSFKEARGDLPLKSIDAELSTQVRNDDPESENSILEIVITSKAGEAIPAGTLVNLTFMISPEAPTLHTIVLENRSEAFTTDDPPERVELTTTNGEIESLDIPALFACFFYMH
ncbi:MAG: hypothetical protein V3S50_03700 [Acidobacteriota bacterium]